MENSNSSFKPFAESPILACRNIYKTYTDSHQQNITVFANLSLTIQAGNFITVLGQSGGGKSTLLKLLGGFIFPSSGTVLFHGTPLEAITPKIGMVFQENTLYPWLNVEQNIGFGFKVRGKPLGHYRSRVEEVMERVGLYHARHLYPHQLSGGMKQRVSIARSIAVDADVLLLDEPFSALDIQLRRRLQRFLQNLWQDTGTTMILVTHNVEEAILLGQQLIVIGGKPGKIIEEINISSNSFRDRYSSCFLELQQYLESVIEEDVEIFTK